jgi:acyl-CoA thioesterase II
VTGIFHSMAGEPFSGPPMTLGGGFGTRILGGYLLSQSVLAAQRTVSAQFSLHALHATFHGAGRPSAPLSADIEITRDGRAFSSRRVVVRQPDRLVATIDLSYHSPDTEHDCGMVVALDGVFDPELATEHTPARSFDGYDDFDVRAANAATTSRAPDGSGSPATTFHPYWVRHRGPVQLDATQQLAALTFITDVAVTGSAHPVGTPMRERFGTVTLNHAVWFHAPARLNEWTLIDAQPVTASAGRGLALGSVKDRHGALLATFAQEALLKP